MGATKQTALAPTENATLDVEALFTGEVKQAHLFTPGLSAMTQTMCAGDLHLVGGRTKEGKSTVVENLVEGLAAQGFAPVWDMTEMTVRETMSRRVGSRIGAPAGPLRRRQWDELPPGTRDRAVEAGRTVQADLQHVRMHSDPLLTPAGVLARMDEADDVYILDSVTQLQFRDSAKKNEEIERLMSQMKDKLIQRNLIGVATNQFNRDDRAGTMLFDRPNPSYFQGSSRLEQICSVALAVTRAVRKGLTPEQFKENMRLIKAQQVDKGIMLEPNVTRVHLMLARDGGGTTVAEHDLFYWFGRLVDMEHADEIRRNPDWRLDFWTRPTLDEAFAL